MARLRLRKVEVDQDPKEIGLYPYKPVYKEGKYVAVPFKGVLTKNEKLFYNRLFKGVVYQENRILIPKEYVYI
jgi:hypothetical protein